MNKSKDTANKKISKFFTVRQAQCAIEKLRIKVLKYQISYSNNIRILDYYQTVRGTLYK